MAGRDKAAEQLSEFKASRGKEEEDLLTTSEGCPIGDKMNVQTAGPRGPMLLQDVVFLDEIAHFARERIPERVVHAKGAGAFGYFEVTSDIMARYCKAKLFNKVGKRTPIAVRFSTVGGESGSADTVRDPRGFAVKFYTEQGNWDLVGNNTPIFFIRDPFFFPAFIHTQKRNPVTHLKDPDMFWDFMTLRPESTHQNFFLFGDRGIPDGFRHMNGYSSHTFMLVDKDDNPVYCKFHYKTNQGIKNILAEKAGELSGSDPDYALRDLYNNIGEKNFPTWTLHVQIMRFDEVDSFPVNPFDLTKIWPQSKHPLIPIGKLVLDRNPKNYFAEVEQMAMSPSNLVPGIEPSPDKMLQGRLVAYTDTHRHRLGANFTQIPVNCPYNTQVSNYQRDGPQTVTNNQDGAPNYYPNSFSGPTQNEAYKERPVPCHGNTARYETSDDDNFSQVTEFWRKVLKPEERKRLIDNMAGHLCKAKDFIQERAIKIYSKVDPEVGKMLKAALDRHNNIISGRL